MTNSAKGSIIWYLDNCGYRIRYTDYVYDAACFTAHRIRPIFRDHKGLTGVE